MSKPVFVLGGFQSDFARNWAREGLGLSDLFIETFQGGLTASSLDAGDIESAHVGNFTAELFCNQGHLGGFFAVADPKMHGIPAARHEAACASGSMALMAAMAEIEAGRYDLVAVLGIEMMRNVPGTQAALNIGGPAMWAGREDEGVMFPWPHMFARLGDEYETRYGLKYEHLAEIARINFSNARRNPNAQTRNWTFTDDSFTQDDAANPEISGRIRKQDCSQITDGAAVMFLASETYARKYADTRGGTLERLPRILGWGHRTGHIGYDEKIAMSTRAPYVFPHVRRTITDACSRAGVAGPREVGGFEAN